MSQPVFTISRTSALSLCARDYHTYKNRKKQHLKTSVLRIWPSRLRRRATTPHCWRVLESLNQPIGLIFAKGDTRVWRAVLYLVLGVIGGDSLLRAAEISLTVAADGSGDFTSVQAAVMSVPEGRPESPVVIRIKPGRYEEQVYLQREKRFFRLVGEDPTTTVLTYNLHANMPGPDGKPIGTFRTPSTHIEADEFQAENLTFENSAGAVGQALALRVDGDRGHLSQLPLLGLARHGACESRPAVVRELRHQGACRFHLRRGHHVFRSLPDSLPGQGLYHGGFDAGCAAVWVRVP